MSTTTTTNEINISSNILVKRAAIAATAANVDEKEDTEQHHHQRRRRRQPIKRLRFCVENEFYNPTATASGELKSQIMKNDEVLHKATNKVINHVQQHIQTILRSDEIIKIIKPIIEDYVLETKKTTTTSSTSRSWINQTRSNDESVVDNGDDPIKTETIFDAAFELQEKLCRPPTRNSSADDERRRCAEDLPVKRKTKTTTAP